MVLVISIYSSIHMFCSCILRIPVFIKYSFHLQHNISRCYLYYIYFFFNVFQCFNMFFNKATVLIFIILGSAPSIGHPLFSLLFSVDLV